MPERPEVTPPYFEILVVRELRKAGLEVTEPRIHRRTELAEPERGFLLELSVWLRRDTGWQKRAFIACRRQEGPVAREAIETLVERLGAAKADVGLMFATTDFASDALAAAEEHGIALLRLVDARTAFDTGGWGPPGHYPAWLPAHLVQVVDHDPTASGGARHRLLEAGRAELVIDRLRARAPAPPGGKDTAHG